jgi:hypothetical protein
MTATFFFCDRKRCAALLYCECFVVELTFLNETSASWPKLDEGTVSKKPLG